MPILLEVGKRDRAQRTMRICIHTLLCLGALGIIYPILIVIGQTLSNDYDLRENAVVPYYLRDRNELVLKHIFAFTNQLHLLASRHNRNAWANHMRMRDDKTFLQTRTDEFAAHGLKLDAWEQITGDLNAFKATQDSDRMLAKAFCIEDYFRPFLRKKYGAKATAFLADYDASGTTPDWFPMMFPDQRERKRVLGKRARLALAIMNRELRSDYLNVHSVEVPKPGNFLVPFWRPGTSAKERLWSEFKASLPPEQKLIISSDSFWHNFLKLKYRNAAGLNEVWGTSYEGIFELVFPLTPPENDLIRQDWAECVVKRWPRSMLAVPQSAAPLWRAYVRGQLLAKAGDGPDAEQQALSEAARLAGTPVQDWTELPFFETRPENDVLSRYWCEFTASGAVPPEQLALLAPERLFQPFLKGKYGNVAAMNSAWQSTFESFERVPLPLALVDVAPTMFTPARLRFSFMVEPYRRVLEYLLGRGRAAQNTLILVLISLVSALTINPIAAYSLSRFPMRHTQKVLIFFLATMAFPAEVAMIPNFLLLRDLGLLNTYAALVLPRMANGFAIFLLKGFYDSLPQELYQAAEIDGASEIQIFRMVAMPLVTPILAYIGLNTFVLTYSGFMWAFVICPKQEMWTLMVWVYDFQMKNPGNNYIMAATVLVSIPPLIVFLFANRLIMKGIVIPSLK
ncbi:MAG: carbohydrate ABC transporter permease [Lentisphaerae bacterium]|jgi:ABC-type glycerol-3-phosphate transport system permease component|nr:carbohydrate ABC transporter permease [Lentisphaerota bacterium]MBT5609339.1 carbohydrate ABC transporter permease [Lentisphaerota bacterium]MBT7054739.1 carbohydrate ABC transporter permease [Lentisphaerota bacterium]MBT7847948.1 carbohydrate ABC transporter permease [Lentisphaerota bacterium]